MQTAQCTLLPTPSCGTALPAGRAGVIENVSVAQSAAPLHVVHVLLSLDVGGLERNVVNQVREAGRLNQRITIVCLERKGSLAQQAEAHGGTVVSMGKLPGLSWKLFGNLSTLFGQIQPDVVHTHQLGTLFYGGRAARRAGVPLVVHTEHGKENYGGRWRTRWLGRVAGRYASRFYCLTQDMAAGVSKNRITSAAKLRVIANGIDSAPFLKRYDSTALRETLGIPQDAPVIGTVGRLNEVKCQNLLLQGFAQLRTSHPDAHLILVGDGPLRPELERLAAALRLGGFIHFTGYQAQTAPYFQLMDIFALTSRSEGLPQAAVEASFAGVPVVASRVGGLPELVEDGRTGLLFESGNVAQFVAALKLLLMDPCKAAALRNAARQRVAARYEIGRMADEYHQYYIEYLQCQCSNKHAPAAGGMCHA